jgi:hypothetical protein
VKGGEMNGMRVLVSTVLGFIFGIVCYLLAKSGSTEPLGAWVVWSIIFGRTLIGFVIGISAWRINYLLHGVLIGLIVSFPLALGSGTKGTNIFWMTLIMGGIYGFFIALITNLIVKEKKEVASTG